MPFRLFVSLLAVGILTASAEPLLQNGDFGAGMSFWEVTGAEANAASVDPQTSHDGNGALCIRQANPSSYTRCTQHVAVQPGQEYVATAWIKADRVVRRGFGVNLFVGDKNGLSIGPRIMARFRQGTYDWTRITVRFNSGGRSDVTVIPYLHEATGAVWFDDISVAPAPPWKGPSGPPTDLPQATVLPDREVYDYQTVRHDVVSPHWRFGKPLAERLRVAVLAPAMAQRESVELAERLDCDVVPLMVHSGDRLGAAHPKYGMLSTEQAHRQLVEELQADYDALVIARVEWGVLGEDLNRIIIEKARAGMGLVYICPKGKRLAPDHPMFQILPIPPAEFSAVGLAGLPGFERVESNETFLGHALQPYQLGKGRLLVVDYGDAAPSDHHYLTPPTRRWREGFAQYDLYMAFVGKAIRWATAAKPGVLLDRLDAPAAIPWGQAGKATCHLAGAVPGKLSVELSIRRLRPSAWDPPVLVEDRDTVGNLIELALPAYVPMGDYVVKVVLRDGKQVLDWGWCRYQVTGQMVIRELDLPNRTLIGSSASIPIGLRFTGELPPGAKLRFDVHDAYGRLAGQTEMPLTEKAFRTDVSCAFSRSIYNLMTVSVLDSAGHPILCDHAEFTVPKPHTYDTFKFIMWGSGGDDYIGSLLRRQAATYGVDGADVPIGGWDARPLAGDERKASRERLLALARVGIAPVPYVSRLWPGEEGASSVRSPCLTDPDFRKAFEEAVDERTAIARPFSPLGITLGDENYVGQTTEYCLSPSCREHLGTWLRQKYKTVEALNQSWGTNYRSFAEAQPILQGALAGPDQWPRWVDWRRNMDSVFAETHKFGADTAQRVIQAVRVGCDGLLSDVPARGYDWGKLAQATGLLNVYLNNEAQVQLLRSLAKPNELRGCWFGAYASERTEPARQRWAPWKQIFSGLNSAWFYAPYTKVGGSGEIGFRPDLSPYDCWSAAASEVDRLKSGIDRLLLTAERDDGAILVVYSRSSALVTALDPRYDEHLDSFAAMGKLLGDAGFPFRAVTAASLAKGVPSDCKAVFLPACVALSDQQGNALRQFAAAGGVLVADWGAGRYDEHGKHREQGVLDDVFGVHGGGSRGFFQPAKGIPGLLPTTAVDGSVRIRNAWPKRFVAGAPVLVTSKQGTGMAVYLNFSLVDYPAYGGARGAPLQDWLRRLLDREGIPKPVVAKGQWGSPDRVETCRWRNGELTFIGFLKNPRTLQMGEDLAFDLPSDQYAYDVLSGRYLGKGKTAKFHLGPGDVKLICLGPERVKSVDLERLKGDEYKTPAYRITVKSGRRAVKSNRVVHVRVFDPAGFPYRAGTVTLLAPEGTCEYDVPFGLGPVEPGRWRVVATDAATGVRAEAAFTMRSRQD
jgi:plasmid stabilization system protein ParE